MADLWVLAQRIGSSSGNGDRALRRSALMSKEVEVLTSIVAIGDMPM
jgi:hypothetical protein